MTEADEATNELIARILAADTDQYGYEEIGNGDLSDDSDYGQPKKRRPKKGAAKAAVKQVGETRAIKRKATEEDEEGDKEFTATGRRKRKDTGAKREGAAKGWTEGEEALFLEGLELYGRDWQKAAAHVGTRDKKAFTSHAQKHFIKLCIADKPLPQKVVDSGVGDGLGYTLSGLPLDPNSSSAKSYGFKPEHLIRLLGSGGPGAKGLLLQGKEHHDGNPENHAADAREKLEVDSANGCVDKGAAGDAQVTETAKHVEKSKLTGKAPAAARSAREAKAEPQPKAAPDLQLAPREPTEYMKNRPKREGAGMNSKWGHTTESLELIQCHEFIGPPGSGASLAQPFEVTVDGQVKLVMDFHSHLCCCEIIGLLGGVWDCNCRRIEVKAAFPCKRVEGSHSGTSVEVDPEAQVQAMQQMEDLGLVSVGWYHSHPIFSPTPSQKDNENQRNQQVLHRCTTTGLEPCLGAIVGPYDNTLPSEASIITWFVVQSRGSEVVPFSIRLGGPSKPPPLPNAALEASLKQLIDVCAADPDRVNFTEEWRPFRLLVDGQPQGGGLSNLSKMRLAIAHHLRGMGADPEAAAAFLDSLFSHLKQAYKIPGALPPEGKADATGGGSAAHVDAAPGSTNDDNREGFGIVPNEPKCGAGGTEHKGA